MRYLRAVLCQPGASKHPQTQMPPERQKGLIFASSKLPCSFLFFALKPYAVTGRHVSAHSTPSLGLRLQNREKLARRGLFLALSPPRWYPSTSLKYTLDTYATMAYIQGMATMTSVEYRLRQVPDDLWWKFKALCALERKGINDKLIEMIAAAIAQPLKPDKN